MGLMRHAGLAACLMLAAVPAQSQMKPCSAVSEPGMKILIDDIVAADPGLAMLANTLASEIGKNLEQLRVEAGLQVTVHTCQARRPQAPSDFSKPVALQLLSRDVVLEVWGKAVASKDASGPYHHTEIGYVIVPVRYYEFGAAQPPGAFVIPLRSKPLQSMDDLVRLLNQSGRLGAYAALASGTVVLKSTPLKEKRWDPARTQLCRSASMLGSIKLPRSEDTALAAYAQKLASAAFDGARRDPAYRGGMKFLSGDATCPK